MSERQRHRNRPRERETDRERERQRQKDRDSERQRQRQRSRLEIKYVEWLQWSYDSTICLTDGVRQLSAHLIMDGNFSAKVARDWTRVKERGIEGEGEK